MGARSTNPTQSFFDDFFRSGKDAVTPPPIPFKATGGDVEFHEGGYEYHVYTTTGASTLVVTSSANIEYVIAGGGGGGGAYRGGGGGAGALNSNMPGFPGSYAGTTFPVSSGTYPVVVGAGGAGGVTSSPPGNGGTGSNSTWTDTAVTLGS